jgi:hypothetical protein
MPETTEATTPEVGNEVRWKTPWASGRGIYMGNQTLFNLESGKMMDIGPAVEIELRTAPESVRSVVVVNPVPTRLGAIVFGVFLGNLMTGIVVGIVLALIHNL